MRETCESISETPSACTPLSAAAEVRAPCRALRAADCASTVFRYSAERLSSVSTLLWVAAPDDSAARSDSR